MKNIEREPITTANPLEKAQSFESRAARAKKLAAFIQAGMALPLLILVACGGSEQQKLETDTYPPGELLIRFDRNLSAEDISEIYKDHKLTFLRDITPPCLPELSSEPCPLYMQHYVRFTPQDPQDNEELIEELSNTPGILLVGPNTLGELQEEAE